MAYTYGTYGVNSFGQKTVLFFCFEGETRQNSTSVMGGQVVELLEDMQEEMSKEEEKDQETHDKQVPRGATRCHVVPHQHRSPLAHSRYCLCGHLSTEHLQGMLVQL